MDKTAAAGQKNTVRILLTKYSDQISSFLYYTGGRGYTHASISLGEEKENCFYSFNFKGFCVETLEKHRKRGVAKSMMYELTVSDKSYETIRERLQFFREHGREFQYTKLGLLFCLLHIPFRWKNHYFCSQFVAEMLEGSEEIKLKKRPALYLPNDFCFELERNPYLKQVHYQVV